MKIWIDICHIPQFNFFKPIIEKLIEKDHEVYVTVLERGKTSLIVHNELHGLEHVKVEVIGQHKLTKWSAIWDANILRICKLIKWGWRKKIDVAISGFTYEEKRAANYLFSNSYFDEGEGDQILVFNKNKVEFVYENVPKYLTEEDEPINFLLDFRRYHSNRVLGSVRTHMKMMNQTYENDVKGFYFVPKATRMKKEKFKTDVKTPVSKETTQILYDLIEELNKHEVEVLFIVSPYIIETDEKENFNYIEEIITESGYTFIDANDYIKETKIDYDTDFYDYAHVNIFGSDKYTDFLSNYINENYDLEDRREDP